MSGESSSETNIPIGEWTTGSLKVYHDDKIAALKELVDQRFKDSYIALNAALVAQEKAIEKANAASEKRFDSVNEFRAQLNDQATTFLPRKEYDARHETLENRVSELNDRLNRSEGQTSGSQVTTSKLYASIAAVGTIIGIIVLLANGVFR